MSKQQLDLELLDLLKKIRRQVRKRLKKGKKAKFAICYMVTVLHGGYSREQHQRLQKLFAKWPKFSGSDVYPVPSTNGMTAGEKYTDAWDNGRLWTGKYGRLRMELLEWLIGYLEAKHGKA